jgi:hypothetical protein
VLSLPLSVLGWFAIQMGFTGSLSTLAQALITLSQGAPERIIQQYPPLPALVATALPSPYSLLLIGALGGGAVLRLLWEELRQTGQHPLVCLALVLSLMISPAFSFLATQSPGEIVTLLLFIIAWRNFLRFMREGTTYNGFMAGLMLGLGFYASIYSLFYALIFALATPVFLRTNRQRLPMTITAVAVVAFPTLMAFVTWGYLNWIFTGRPFGFWDNVTTPVMLHFGEALGLTLREMLQLPLYPLVGLMIGVYAPKRLPVYLAPLLLIALARTIGLAYSEAFAISMYSVIALISLPRCALPLWGVGLVFVAIAQLTLPSYTPEIQSWRSVLLSGEIQSPTALQQELAAKFGALPPRRILADSRTVEPFIALAGTAQPFVLPGDSTFQLALSNPKDRVDYLVIAPHDALASHYGDRLPDGFVPTLQLDGWTLYEREGVE